MNNPFDIKFANGLTGDPAVLMQSRRSGEHVLFDLGDISNLSHKEVLKVRKIFLSHTHMDHFYGFDKLLRFNIPHRKQVEVFGPKGLGKNVQGKLKGYTWNLIDDDQIPFKICELDGKPNQKHYFCGKKSNFELEELGAKEGSLLAVLEDKSQVFGIALDHNGIDSISYQVKAPPFTRVDSDALVKLGLRSGSWIAELLDRAKDMTPGDKITIEDQEYSVESLKDQLLIDGSHYVFSYVTDIGFTKSNIKLIQNNFLKSDSLVIECSFKDAELARSVQKAHLTSKQSALIAAVLKCRSFQPFHVSNIYDGREEEVIDEARSFFNVFNEMDSEKLKIELLKEHERISQCRSDLGVP